MWLTRLNHGNELYKQILLRKSMGFKILNYTQLWKRTVILVNSYTSKVIKTKWMRNAPRAQYLQQPGLLFGMNSPFFQPFHVNTALGGLEGLERVMDKLGDTISTLEPVKEPLLRGQVQDGDAAVPQHNTTLLDPPPSPARAHQSASPLHRGFADWLIIFITLVVHRAMV